MPVSNAIPLHLPVGERRLYGPFVGAALVLGALSARGKHWRNRACLLICLGALFGAGTIERSLLLKTRLAWLKDNVRKSPYDSGCRLALGSVYQERGVLRQAQRQIEMAFSLNPHQLVKMADVDRAMILAENIANANIRRSDAASALNNLGGVLHKRCMYAKAEKLYRLALKLDPGCSYALNNLGILLAQQGRLEDAAACYRRAVTVSPAYLNAYFNLGECYRRLGQFSLAEKNLKLVLAMDPRHVRALNALGNTYQAMGKLKEAEQQYRNALRAAPGYWQTMASLGGCLFLMGRHDEAIKMLDEALKIRPDCVEAWYNLAEAYQQKGQTGEAIRMLKAALAHISLRPFHARRSTLEQMVRNRLNTLEKVSEK